MASDFMPRNGDTRKEKLLAYFKRIIIHVINLITFKSRCSWLTWYWRSTL